jgi:hypothetical protein
MPISVDDVATLEVYLQGVMNRSEHHAETVGAIALALLGAVLWRKDGKPLEVRRYAGEPANIVWFDVDGNRYALAYNHGADCNVQTVHPPGSPHGQRASTFGSRLWRRYLHPIPGSHGNLYPRYGDPRMLFVLGFRLLAVNK